MPGIRLPSLAPVDYLPHSMPALILWLVKMGQLIGWGGAYVLILRQARKDRYMAIPVVAVCFNFAWEFVFSFVIYQPLTQRSVSYVWVLLDAFIVWQGFKIGRKDFPTLPSRFYTLCISSLLVFATLFTIAASYEFKDQDGGYVAFSVNVLMSYLFINMLWKRKSSIGQSMYIAVGKWIGTMSAAVEFAIWYPGRWLLSLFYCTVFVLDVTYIVLLYRQIRLEGESPWRWNRRPGREPELVAGGLVPAQAGS